LLFSDPATVILSALHDPRAMELIQWTSDIRTSDIRTLAYRDTLKHVPAKVVLCYPRLLIRTLAYKDTKMLVPAVSLYPRFTVNASSVLLFERGWLTVRQVFYSKLAIIRTSNLHNENTHTHKHTHARTHARERERTSSGIKGLHLPCGVGVLKKKKKKNCTI
jgi:hypothetical protein